MEITMARGDLELRTFQIRSPDLNDPTGKSTIPYTDPLDEIYFTVKKSHTDKEYKFQKRLTTMGILSLGNGEYQITIDPEDTDGLLFGTYEFDIELVREGDLKRTYCGELNLTREVTHRSNEVVL